MLELQKQQDVASEEELQKRLRDAIGAKYSKLEGSITARRDVLDGASTQLCTLLAESADANVLMTKAVDNHAASGTDAALALCWLQRTDGESVDVAVAQKHLRNIRAEVSGMQRIALAAKVMAKVGACS